MRVPSILDGIAASPREKDSDLRPMSTKFIESVNEDSVLIGGPGIPTQIWDEVIRETVPALTCRAPWH
jgi:hypothetical protein